MQALTAAQCRDEGHAWIERMGRGEGSIDLLKNSDSEGVTEVIEALSLALNAYHKAANVPKIGQVTCR